MLVAELPGVDSDLAVPSSSHPRGIAATGSVDVSPVDWPASAEGGDGELHGQSGAGGQHLLSIESREQINFIVQPFDGQDWFDSVDMDCSLIQR